MAFSDIGAGGAVYFSNGGSLSDLTADKPLSTFTVFSHPMINGDGTVVFALAASSPPDFPNGAVFRSKAGGPAELAVKGPGTLTGLSISAPTINDGGVIAYSSNTLNLPAGVQFGVNVVTGTSTSKVIQSGDLLFGGTVASAGSPGGTPTSRYLNSAGQVAFWYALTNGVKGIAVATPAGN